MWEFPGGKIKKNENIIHALKRELLEEVGITILKFQFFQHNKYVSFKKKLKLYFFLIYKWNGKPYSKEGYFYVWEFFYNLNFDEFPLENFNVLNSLKNNANIFDAAI